MKISHYLKKLEKSKEYKEFKEKDPKSYLCSSFIIRDYETNKHETQIDFFSPKSKKIVSFKVNDKVEKIPIDKKAETLMHKKYTPKELKDKVKLDIDELKLIIADEMQNRKLTDEIK